MKNAYTAGAFAMLFASQGYRGSTNDLSVFEYLENLGIAANVVTESGQTPLHNLAFRAKDPAVYAFFIEWGVDINQADEDGNTLLLNAARGRNTDIASMYIPKVADINHKNKEGHTALTYAVRAGQQDLVDELLAHGAQADIIDAAGNNLAGHLFSTYSENKREAFTALLATLKQKEIAFDAQQGDGNSLVHIAVDKESPYLLDEALALNASLNAKNSNGLTPLHFAAMKAKDPEMIQLLIAKGADTTIKTDFEETVYDLAAENELLKDTGFDLGTLKN
jgi:ankyrin repeat protein